MKELTEATFGKEVLKSKRPVFVMFYHPQCGPCQLMHPVYSKAAVKFSKKAKFTQINVDKGMKTANKYQIKATPTILVFKNGIDDAEIEGFADEPTLNGFFTQIIGSP